MVKRIEFKALYMTFKILKLSSPGILANMLVPYMPVVLLGAISGYCPAG